MEQGARSSSGSAAPRLRLDPGSTVPVSEQLRAQLAVQVRDGQLVAGTSLPTVRALAADLGLAPNTVAKVYRSLEQDGLVLTAGRRGTVVAEQDVGRTAAARRRVEECVAALRTLGVSPAETVRLVQDVLGTASAQPEHRA